MYSMTFNNTFIFIEKSATTMSNLHVSTIQGKPIWKSLRSHILSRREKVKPGMFATCR